MDGHQMSNGTMTMDAMAMQMYFYVGSKATILFKSWNTSTWAGMLGSFIAVFLIAMLYEAIKVLRAHLKNRRANRGLQGAAKQGNENETQNENTNLTGSRGQRSRTIRIILSRIHLLRTGLYLLQVTLGYCLMLVAMTFNLWLLVAVVTGLTAGYFAIGWKRSEDELDDDCCA